MKTFILRRIVHNTQGTWGVMLHDLQPFCVTLELPWRNNARNVSCIPAGRYTAFRRLSGIRGRGIVFQLKGVPNRTAIQIHKGNFTSDILGCIILGEKYEDIGSKKAIQQSKPAFKEFMRKATGKNIRLIILAPNIPKIA